MEDWKVIADVITYFMRKAAHQNGITCQLAHIA